jgi:hypothetical protein
MKRKILFTLISISTLLFQSTLYAGNIDLKFFSSETGISIIPDELIIYNTSNGQNILPPVNMLSNNFSVSLNEGTYSITVVKAGYISSQTSFDINSSDIICSMFLDPLTANTKLNTPRIKSLLKPDAALLIGYVVDDNTGEPLANTTVKDGNSKVLGTTDVNGYFEFYIPANCETRTFVSLNFERAPYDIKVYKDFEVTPNTDYILQPD